jgi:DNA-binding MarR family transcriptional regulator
MERDDWAAATSALALAGRLVEGIQAGMVARGFDDVRPAHGFAFVRISAGSATNADVAAHLGITKQAASQLMEQLVRRGYVTRTSDPRDARNRLLNLTERGLACTRAAEEAAAEVVAGWRLELGPSRFTALRESLETIAGPGPLRIPW